MKAFTPNGYKQVTIMCFGESAPKISCIRPGTVLQVINPKLMSIMNSEHGICFSISSEQQFNMVGYSEHYNTCDGKEKSKTQEGMSFKCRAFLNRSTESICDRHKLCQALVVNNKVKSHRPNIMGDRVDINALRKIQAMEDKEKFIGAFGGKTGGGLQRNRAPVKMLSPTAAEKA